MNTLSDLQNRIQNSKALDFGNILNDSIELFKKGWLQGLLMMLLHMAFMFPLMLVMYLPMLFFGFLNFQIFEEQSASVLTLVFLFIMMIFMILVISVVAFALQAGFFRICKQLDQGETTGFNYLYFLNKDYFGKIATLMLMTLGINIAAILLCVLPVFYVMVPISMIPVVFAFNPHLSASEILKLSFDLGNKKWLLIFGLAIVSGIMAELVGLLMCGIGIFVTMSFVFMPRYFVYKETVGFDEDDAIKRIGVIDQ